MDERHRHPALFINACLVCLLAAPPVFAAILTTKVPSSRPVVAHKQLESLTFVQYSVDLGLVEAVGNVPAHFDFTNNGRTPIEITQLIPSCGCLAPKIYADKMRYEPGEVGRFYVAVKTANESSGPKEYNVQVQYSDGQPKQQTVTFRLEIPARKVSVTPSELYFYQTHGQPDSREILVTDHRGQALNVTDVNSNSELVSVLVGEKQVDDTGARIPIRVDVPGAVPEGKAISNLRISTDDPEYPEIFVAVVIWGPDPPAIQQTGGTPARRVKIDAAVQPPDADQDQPLSQSSEF